MGYGFDVSWAYGLNGGDIDRYCVESSIVRHFKYAPTATGVYARDFSPEAWANLIKNEIDSLRPVIYGGNSHSFICDGYDNNGLFHFNLGWGGSWNGYYDINNMYLGSDGYSIGESDAVIGIKPSQHFGNSSMAIILSDNSEHGTTLGSGTYPFGSTITASITAKDGYIFDHWDDGNRYGIREMFSTGDTIRLTASFNKVEGDTLGYCLGWSGTSWQTGNTTEWAIKLPACMLDESHDLTGVQFFSVRQGTYYLTVYQGSYSPQTILYSGNYTTSSDTPGWHTIHLPSTIHIDGTKSLWLCLKSDAPYPLAVSNYTGSPNSLLLRSGSSFYSNALNWEASAMIRGLFVDTTTTVAFSQQPATQAETPKLQ